MAGIILKTYKRKLTVPRSAIRKAVNEVFNERLAKREKLGAAQAKPKAKTKSAAQ